MQNEPIKLEGVPIRLLLLDNFYESSASKEAQALFGSILNWKIQGYRTRYNASFIPLDQSDYFNRHYVFCFEEEDGSLTPFSGQRYVSLHRCLKYNSTLPLLSSVQNSQCQSNIEFLENQITNSIKENKDLIYPSGYTLNKEFSGKKEFSTFGAETTAAIHHYERTLNPQTFFVTASVLRFKTYRLLKMVGHEFATFNQVELPSFKKTQAGDEELKLMKLETTSPWSTLCFKKLEPLFKNAIRIENTINLRLNQAA